MQPTLVRPLFHRPGWIYETKYDGWRMFALKDGASVRLVGRQGVDHTAHFGEIAAGVGNVSARTLVLDGEVCVFRLSARVPSPAPRRPQGAGDLGRLHRFNCVRLGGKDVRHQPLSYRRGALKESSS
jgi:bifunctional non-homologous end joining protein LigD